MNKKLKDQDVLLIKDRDNDKLKVVTAVNENGTPKAVIPRQTNEPEFMKIDKHGNALDNFMSNFLQQRKDPTHFQFFRVPLSTLGNAVNILESMLKGPDNSSNKSFWRRFVSCMSLSLRNNTRLLMNRILIAHSLKN